LQNLQGHRFCTQSATAPLGVSSNLDAATISLTSTQAGKSAETSAIDFNIHEFNLRAGWPPLRSGLAINDVSNAGQGRAAPDPDTPAAIYGRKAAKPFVINRRVRKLLSLLDRGTKSSRLNGVNNLRELQDKMGSGLLYSTT
jgi:hypothetical protein